ncbi:hypothetical protein KS4_16520 [Poriferisphaera corsica]|uniref:Uncharacterized protein n=1 Tax=Poriferisphaera corsica TaxID=2528020 RepID=A0A517YTN6_9BACT|nr:hypothetical protein [Poriferisphaera corsica]QDU33600.1 hypothetical protein KS4_16520 [Poriferisphaera corsica]
MLELKCPNCQNTLKLDDGFAGSVCRCSFCGLLMTVPDLPNLRDHQTKISEIAESTISRLDSPLSELPKQIPSETYKLKRKSSRRTKAFKLIILLLLTLSAIALTIYIVIYLNAHPITLT